MRAPQVIRDNTHVVRRDLLRVAHIDRGDENEQRLRTLHPLERVEHLYRALVVDLLRQLLAARAPCAGGEVHDIRARKNRREVAHWRVGEREHVWNCVDGLDVGCLRGVADDGRHFVGGREESGEAQGHLGGVILDIRP